MTPRTPRRAAVRTENSGKPAAVAPPSVRAGRTSAVPERNTDLLKRLLADQRAATLQARADAADLQKQLEQARAELATHQSENPSTSTPEPSDEVPDTVPSEGDAPPDDPQPYHPEAALLKVQIERSEKALKRAQVDQRKESAHGTAKVAGLKEALRIAHANTFGEGVPVYRHVWVRIFAGGATLLALVGLVAMGAWIGRRRTTDAVSSVAPPPLAAKRLQAADPRGPVLTETLPAPRAKEANPPTDFALGVDRLSLAFDRFPGVDPEVVMAAVNKRAAPGGVPPCGFVWNEGEPSLQFGNEAKGEGSVAHTLSRCAEAVEKFQ